MKKENSGDAQRIASVLEREARYGETLKFWREWFPGYCAERPDFWQDWKVVAWDFAESFAARAISAERERCAKIAENRPEFIGKSEISEYSEACRGVAAAIRKDFDV